MTLDSYARKQIRQIAERLYWYYMHNESVSPVDAKAFSEELMGMVGTDDA